MNKQLVDLSHTTWPLPDQRKKRVGYGRRQSGAAALLVTLILVIVASLGALVVNTAAFNEQKLSGVDLRGKEVYAAAVGALAHGVNELELLYLDQDEDFDTSAAFAYTDGNANGIFDAGDTAVPLVNFVNASGGTTINQGTDTYTPSILYTLLTDPGDSPAIIEIAATATAVGDTQVQKIITQQYLLSVVGRPSLFNGPPVVVGKCMSGVTGTPDIVADGVAIASLEGNCVEQGAFEIDGTGTVEEGVGDGTSLYETFFGTVPREELKRLSTLEAENNITPRTYYYIDADFTDPSGLTTWNGNTWSDDIGSGTYTMPAGPATLEHGVVLFFGSSVGCPPVNGNVEIWGLVFYDADSCDTTIGAQGGGKATIYGTLAFTGDLNKYTANTIIYELDLEAPPGKKDNVRLVTALPGSWVDF